MGIISISAGDYTLQNIRALPYINHFIIVNLVLEFLPIKLLNGTAELTLNPRRRNLTSSYSVDAKHLTGEEFSFLERTFLFTD